MAMQIMRCSAQVRRRLLFLEGHIGPGQERAAADRGGSSKFYLPDDMLQTGIVYVSVGR
jgi:hypothetical protein